jgi:hypothetical protein
MVALSVALAAENRDPAPEGEFATGTVAPCCFFRMPAEAAPGINRAAHSVPWGICGLGGKKGEDTSDQFQFVSLNLNRQRALDRLD